MSPTNLQDERTLLSPEERRELEQTAQVFEMIVAVSPMEMGALEALREIYGRLGEESKLADVLERLGKVSAEPEPLPPAHPQTADPAETTPPALEADDASRREPLAAAPPPEVKDTGAPADTVADRDSTVATAAGPAMPADAGSGGADLVERRLGRLARLGDLMVAAGLITPALLQQAVREQRNSGEKIGAVLVRLGFISEDQLVGFLSRQYGVPPIALSQLDIDPEIVKLIPSQMARKYEVLPIRREGEALTLAMGDPANVLALDDVAFLTNLRIVPVVAAQGAIRKAIERLYDTQTADIADVISEATASTELEVVEGEEETWSKVDVFELKESADEAPVVRLVNMIFVDAVRRGASDIHLEPYEKVFRVRFRVDGVLHEMMTPPKRLEAALTSRVKIMASLDIAERRLPQDGRIKLRYHQREIDLRVSTLPTIFGEKTVLRILDREALQLDLSRLGFDPWSLEHFTRAIRQPYGMILITGPTGSGKTTTLYSAIHTINSPDVNIMTVEDPVEYNLKGVNQVQVKEEIGRTFAAALRSFLRQDPDIILVGETRDLETAQIAVRAALTGHLVLSTLHTNDSPSTVARLLDMGVPPFLVASSLTLILAQRLARRVCMDCRQPYEVDEDSLTPYGYLPQGRGRLVLYRGKGCATCSFTGMKGRVAIYEVMPVSEELRSLILRAAPTADLREVAASQGMKTLRHNALGKAVEGVTTVEEILRVTIG